MSLIPGALTTIAALRLYLDRHRTEVQTGTLSDGDLEVWINCCSASAEIYCKRWIAARSATVYVPYTGDVIALSGPGAPDGAFPIRSVTSVVLEHRDGTSETLDQSDVTGWSALHLDQRKGLIQQHGFCGTTRDEWAVTGEFGLLPLTGGALDATATATEARDYATIAQAVTLWCARSAAVRIGGQQSISFDMARLAVDNADIPSQVRALLDPFTRPSL